MGVPCPGQETFSHIYGAGRDGPTPFAAYVSALLVLVREMAMSQSLKDFINAHCDPPCSEVKTGPGFTRTSVRFSQKPGGVWHCVMGGLVEGEVDCKKVVTVSDEEVLRQIVAVLEEEGLEGKGGGEGRGKGGRKV